MTQSPPDPTIAAPPAVPEPAAAAPAATPVPAAPPAAPIAASNGGSSFPQVQQQAVWGLWIASFFLIPYVLWYARINKELCAILGEEVPMNGTAISVFIPIVNILGLFATADRLNRAAAKVGADVQVGGFMAAILAPAWFASQTRYLQRRMNTLHDAIAAK